MWHKILWIILLATIITPPLSAQDEVKPVSLVKEISMLEKPIDIDFPGGSIRSFLDSIMRTNGFCPNVVVSDEAADLKLPAIRLHTVTLYEAIQAIENLGVLDDCKIEVKTDRNVMTIMAFHVGQKPQKKKSDLRVFDVSRAITEHYGIDDIVTAVTTAWKMQAGDDDPVAELKYHKETNLLIAVGDVQDLRLVENVIVELATAKELAHQHKAMKQTNKEIQHLRQVVEELKSINMELKQENMVLHQRIGQLEGELNARTK